MTTREENRSYWQDKVADNPLLAMTTAIQEVAKGIGAGAITSTHIFIGPPGCGKTTATEQSLKKNNVSYIKLDTASSVALALALNDAATSGQTVVLDDAGSLWANSRSLQVMLRATLPSGERKYSMTYADRRRDRVLDFGRLPMIVLTNRSSQDWNLNKSEIEALLDRCEVVEAKANAQDAFDYTCYLAICRENLKPLEVSVETANELLSFFADHANDLPKVSPRSFYELVRRARNMPSSWRKRTVESFVAIERDADRIEVPFRPQIVPQSTSSRASSRKKLQQGKSNQASLDLICRFRRTNEVALSAEDRLRVLNIIKHGRLKTDPTQTARFLRQNLGLRVNASHVNSVYACLTHED